MFNSINVKLLGALTLCMSLVLSGCGGSGAGANGVVPETSSSSSSSSSTSTSTSSGTVTTATKVALLAGSSVLASDGKTPVEITAVVTSASNVAEAAKPVVFAVEDPIASSGVRLEVTTAITDLGGVAKAKLYLLSDSTERTVKVTAKSGDATVAEVLVKVTGNNLSLSGPQQLPLNGSPSAFTILLKNSSGEAVANKVVQLKSAKGNTLSSPSVTTDSSGQASFTVLGTVGGDDTIDITTLGVTTTKAVKVSGENLTITPASLIIPINTTQTVNIAYAKSAPIATGTSASASITQGTVSSATVAIPAGANSGAAAFTVRSSFAGPATITVNVGGNEATVNVNFVSVTPTAIALQTNPAIIGPNAGTSTDQRTQLIAQVRDAAGNPVANQRVTFSAVKNPSGGLIQPGVATTDFAGRATVAYIAGANTSPTNGVEIVATVTDAAISSSPAFLSVSQTQLFVRIGTNNLVEEISPVIYALRYAIVVTDATGNPIKNAQVQAKVKALRYQPGFWSIRDVLTGVDATTTEKKWVRTELADLVSEDLNGDGQCIATLDLNTDGQLTPGNVASATAGLTTNDNGFAEVLISYPKSFGSWVDVQLEVTVAVGGTEGKALASFPLVISASDVSDLAKSPPGVVSPFGTVSPYGYVNPRPGKRCGEP